MTEFSAHPLLGIYFAILEMSDWNTGCICTRSAGIGVPVHYGNEVHLV